MSDVAACLPLLSLPSLAWVGTRLSHRRPGLLSQAQVLGKASATQECTGAHGRLALYPCTLDGFGRSICDSVIRFFERKISQFSVHISLLLISIVPLMDYCIRVVRQACLDARPKESACLASTRKPEERSSSSSRCAAGISRVQLLQDSWCKRVLPA